MNCKPGDMAMIIRGHQLTRIGQVVTCKSVISVFETMMFHISHAGPVWKIDQEITWITADGTALINVPLCPDSCLMPINPLDDDIIETPETMNME